MAAAVVGLDLLTKAWAEQALPAHRPVAVVGDFARLTLGYNSGAAFGLFASGSVLLVLVTGFIIGGLLIWVGKALRGGQGLRALWPLSLLVGGAAANFADRLPDRRVTDFLDFGLGALRWPTFNLADTAITVGVICFLAIVLPRKPTGVTSDL